GGVFHGLFCPSCECQALFFDLKRSSIFSRVWRGAAAPFDPYPYSLEREGQTTLLRKKLGLDLIAPHIKFLWPKNNKNSLKPPNLPFMLVEIVLIRTSIDNYRLLPAVFMGPKHCTGL
ncbi:MAG TPA: hypothetical protein PLV61_07815, partial [Parvularculaceae bacterium]|nr:hypothetical protein [Parvularculaceae bacterium]